MFNSQLIDHYDYILTQLEQNELVDVIYLDFAKAFDKVDHDILCRKVKNIGICGKLGVWIHNFLSSRNQRIKTGGVFPNLSKVTSYS